MSLRKGMTLIEVIVAMTIFAIIVVMIFPALAVLNQNNTATREILKATYVSQDIAERINAYTVETSASPEGLRTFLESDSDYIFVCSEYESGMPHFTCDASKNNFNVSLEVFSIPDGELLKRVLITSENTQDKTRSSLELVVRFI